MERVSLTEQIEELPVLPVRGQVLFPNSIMPLTIGRTSSLSALESLDEDKRIAVVAQRDPGQDEVTIDDLYEVGTVGVVLRVARITKDQESVVAFIHGLQRIRVLDQVQRRPHLMVEALMLFDIPPRPGAAEVVALTRNIKELFREIIFDSSSLPDDMASVASNIEDPSVLVDLIASSAPFLSLEARQELLETLDVVRRMRRLTEELVAEREEQKLQNKIRAEITGRFTESQREMFLREQLRAIQRELGELDDGQQDVLELRTRLDEVGLPEEVRREAERELERLARIPPASPEHTVARTYLDWLASLPWRKSTATAHIDLRWATAILEEDHYDLEKVKERILEYLAVYARKQNMKGPILCLVGPPGVGKTSLGRSIARATGRAFVRLSLGGVHDEAEIRGHRRTYIGALPGQIIRSMRRAGASDPVFMLDEVDKIGRHFHGDPASALLEVLDPEQNMAFRDHYLDVPFDLSRVLFITTANILDPVPPALLDRMETLELAGYIDEEKLHIARRYLIPRQAEENALELDTQIRFTDQGIQSIIHGYTHEAGVRSLERNIGAICRKRVRQLMQNGAGDFTVVPETVRELLGAPRFRIETELEQRTRTPGVAVAVAWTPYGGDVLFVETARLPRDRGDFTITGQVREVMQESARIALSWLRASAQAYGVDPRAFRDSEVHIHVPSGSVPKDGPSAGIVMVTALVSLYLARPVKPHVAMTGEITLSGMVLPVGGIKEKVLAARRSGVKSMILPAQNEPNVLEEIPAHLREGLEIHFVETIDAALGHAFEPAIERRGEILLDRTGEDRRAAEQGRRQAAQRITL